MVERGLTQAALCERAAVGAGTMRDILLRGHIPKVETLFRLADALESSRLDLLVVAGHLRREEPATGGVACPEAGDHLVQELLDEFRRIPEQHKPQALAYLRALAGSHDPKSLPPDPAYFSPGDDLRSSQDPAPEAPARKRDIAHYTFEWVTSIRPRRDPSGAIAQQVYDQPGERLNRHGAGPFCRFDFPKNWSFAGVYSITVEEQVTYVGECKNLSVRFSPLGYGHITARNCLHNGQATNCRVNALILAQCLTGKSVDVWFLRSRKRHRIEEELCGLLQPPWNRPHGWRRRAPARQSRGDTSVPSQEGSRGGQT